MADTRRLHPVYGDHPPWFPRLAGVELTRWQERLLAEVMALPSNRADPAYQVAARRARAVGRPGRLMASFYEEVAAYYLRRPRRSAMHSAYRSRMIARRRRG